MGAVLDRAVSDTQDRHPDTIVLWWVLRVAVSVGCLAGGVQALRGSAAARRRARALGFQGPFASFGVPAFGALQVVLAWLTLLAPHALSTAVVVVALVAGVVGDVVGGDLLFAALERAAGSLGCATALLWLQTSTIANFFPDHPRWVAAVYRLGWPTAPSLFIFHVELCAFGVAVVLALAFMLREVVAPLVLVEATAARKEARSARRQQRQERQQQPSQRDHEE